MAEPGPPVRLKLTPGARRRASTTNTVPACRKLSPSMTVTALPMRSGSTAVRVALTTSGDKGSSARAGAMASWP
ncbi:hypothetical protein GCM10011505_26020 [Tistrella bauzanensis]|uniref:Uncharacterized protein n=1 Tax=Tistrella bauzanensis TaxID=657419 RepID=A0ABQ1IJ18_9PROT|nr:hypothetical protein GCM10011505_26020 [Tistrella bauzanensis]